MPMRNIEVDGKSYKWVCGRSHVVIKDENGKRISPPDLLASDVKGITPDLFDRGKWKITSDGMLLPSEVATYIKTRLK